MCVCVCVSIVETAEVLLFFSLQMTEEFQRLSDCFNVANCKAHRLFESTSQIQGLVKIGIINNSRLNRLWCRGLEIQ